MCRQGLRALVTFNAVCGAACSLWGKKKISNTVINITKKFLKLLKAKPINCFKLFLALKATFS